MLLAIAQTYLLLHATQPPQTPQCSFRSAVVYMVTPCTCLPILLCHRPFFILYVSFGAAGQIDLTEWESVIQAPSISKIAFSDVIWTAPSTSADSGEERNASSSQQGCDEAPSAPGQAVSPM